jgi:heptosyltransferase-2
MKILIELPTWLGDTVMVTPAIENLINHFGDLEISLIGSYVSIETLKNHPKVIETYEIEKQFRFYKKFTKELGRFDNFFSFRGSYRSTILKLFIESPNKYQFSRFKYQDQHQVEKYNSFINDCIGENFSANNLKVYKSDKLKTDVSKNIVGINPGASYGDAKRWYPKEFAKVALRLSSKYEIMIFGGPNEIDIAHDIEKLLVREGVSNYQNLAGKTTIEELINLISSLSLFITGDSGPMHLAASFQVPTVAIFGPTQSLETSQWLNEKSVIVKKDLNCQPCMKRECPLKHHDCMKLVKADEVLAQISSFD